MRLLLVLVIDLGNLHALSYLRDGLIKAERGSGLNSLLDGSKFGLILLTSLGLLDDSILSAHEGWCSHRLSSVEVDSMMLDGG